MHTFVRPFGCSLCVFALAVACGGARAEPEEPEPPAQRRAPVAQTEPSDTADEAEEETDEDARGETEPTPAEPDFPENASVEEAIAAVPQGSERLNIDHETLAKPLQNPDLYEPCKAGNQHFKMKIAVWNGRAVGVDVVTKNQKLKECLTARLREIEWDDKVPSLNTIEYGF